MMQIIIAAAGALIAGFLIGFLISRKNTNRAVEEAEGKVKLMIQKAELESEEIKNKKLNEARDKYNDLKKRGEEEERQRKQKLDANDNRVRQKEQAVNQRMEQQKKEETQLINQREVIARKEEALKKKMEETDRLHASQVQELEKISNLSAEQAKEKLMQALTDEARSLASTQIKDVLEEAKITANKEAKRIIIQTIQRTASEHAIENTVSVFPLENDEIKGRIIGREGRNIRALEAATGIEIIVDDTPEAIILSGFDPVRREIARLALHKLVGDGRIHPARIEEVVAKVTKQINEEIMETGERTVIELGIHGLHADLVRIVGKMKYRSSYGQNLLQHSKEVARLCATMASELGLNAKLAKRAGLLHDIGKVPDDQPELPHALLGMELAIKYKEVPEVCNAIGAHHDEIEMTSVISPIIQACDAISGSRPGARREIVEGYIKRLKDLEALAASYPGVTKSYAIQAGRELRVIVESEKVTDEQSDLLAFQISQQIQNEMQYPGQIKVTVIREKRAIAYAK